MRRVPVLLPANPLIPYNTDRFKKSSGNLRRHLSAEYQYKFVRLLYQRNHLQLHYPQTAYNSRKKWKYPNVQKYHLEQSPLAQKNYHLFFVIGNLCTWLPFSGSFWRALPHPILCFQSVSQLDLLFEENHDKAQHCECYANLPNTL
jgi:hypothetical protein